LFALFPLPSPPARLLLLLQLLVLHLGINDDCGRGGDVARFLRIHDNRQGPTAPPMNAEARKAVVLWIPFPQIRA